MKITSCLPGYLDYRLYKETECLSLSLPSFSSTNKDLVNMTTVQFIATLIMTGFTKGKKEKETKEKEKKKRKKTPNKTKNPEFQDQIF